MRTASTAVVALLAACSGRPTAEQTGPVRLVIVARPQVTGVPLANTRQVLGRMGHVEKVAAVDWFQADYGGVLVTGFAVEPAFFTVPSQLVLDDAARRAFAADPQACLALASLTQARGWRASQRVTVPEIVTGHLAEDPIHCTLVGVVGTADGRDYGQIFLRGELLRDRSSATRPDRADAVVVAVPGRHGQTAATELGRALPGLDVFVDHDRTWGRQVPVTGGSSAPPDVAPQ